MILTGSENHVYSSSKELMTIEKLEVSGHKNVVRNVSVMNLIIYGDANEFDNVSYVNKIESGKNNIVKL